MALNEELSKGRFTSVDCPKMPKNQATFTSLEFDNSGEFFAAGDTAGKICLYGWGEKEESEVDELESSENDKEEEISGEGRMKFGYYGQFQSHEREFDYLRSQEIEEKIVAIRWLPQFSPSKSILTANEKTIKLWKIYDKVSHEFIKEETSNSGEYSIPRFRPLEELTAVSLKQNFKKAHSFHINSLSISPDRETFLSSDDLRIYIWSLRDASETYNIVDLKPENMEKLLEVIISAKFDPEDANILAFSTNEGAIKYNDLRVSSNFELDLKVLSKDSSGIQSSFTDATSSISDFKFVPGTHSVIARDYISVKKWDDRNGNQPVKSVRVGDLMAPHLQSLFESEKIFDRFDLTLMGSGGECATGIYGKNVAFCDMEKQKKEFYHFTKKTVKSVNTDSFEQNDPFSLKEGVLKAAYHPFSNSLVLACDSELFVIESSKENEM